VVLGEMCRIRTRDGAQVAAEVVGLRPGTVTLMPYGSMQGLAAGCEIEALGSVATVPVGDELLGRVIDGFGHALDGRPDPVCRTLQPLRAEPLNPMQRPRIDRVLETGVRSIDALLTLGQGQRVGIFAGSGVGKSTLLGMVARHVRADVNVIALIGERGREVKEFIDNHLGPQGLARSVVVVATSDQPALARLRAALAAVAVAEHFRARGKQVMLTMDSITRYAMARREIGLAAGEPPTARGYTPSVFAELPQLCERCGTDAGGGAITALFKRTGLGPAAGDAGWPHRAIARAGAPRPVPGDRRVAKRQPPAARFGFGPGARAGAGRATPARAAGTQPADGRDRRLHARG
jgi:flagellum-specific ATP synthase